MPEAVIQIVFSASPSKEEIEGDGDKDEGNYKVRLLPAAEM